jgi:colanic acid/amylovoran biosynthesis glycosyltransferase
MKVNFCTLDWPNYVGGPNTNLLRLLPELKNKGIECSILVFTYQAAPEKCSTVVKFRSMGFSCTATKTPVYMENRVRWILTKIKNNPPDIFIPNLTVPAYYAGRWIKEANIPTVGVIRSDDLTYRAIQNKFIFGDPNYRLTATVCVSEYLEKEICKQQKNKILVRRIPSGVPIPTNKAHSRADKKIRLVYSGRLVEEQKRISEVTRAFCRVVSELPNTEAIIYGEGPAEKNIKQILSNEGDGLPIHFAGRIDSDKIQDVILESHVIVLLSDYEGLPISVMEAMACGVVPVCLKIRSGIPELIEHEKTGLLVNDREDDFVNAIRRLQTEPGLWERLSKSARAKVEEGYSVEESARRWVLLFNELDEKYKTKLTIQIPRKIVLPPAHPDLAQGDIRKPPFLILLTRGMWRRVLKITNILLGNINNI